MTDFRFLSVCSGIEAASVAWEPLGWQAAGLSEIENFPRAVLQHRLGAQPVDWDHRFTPGRNSPPLFGDFTRIEQHHVGPIDLLVGGTPCQSFSIAGLRGGLADDRGNLALEFLRLADRTRPRWLVWENVPGVLSSNGGRDFGSILGGLVELGYGFAWRVLDAQHFGVPQRRRRVFLVANPGDWRRAAAVLFERHSLSGHPPPRREKGPSVAALTANGVGTCGADDNQGQAGHLIPDIVRDGGLSQREWPAQVAPTLNAAFGSKLWLENQHIDSGAGHFVAHALRGEGFDASEDGTGRGTPLVPVAYRTSPNCGAWETGDRTDAITTGTDRTSTVLAYAIQERAVSENPDAGPDGAGWRGDGAAYTLEARTVPQAVAFMENQQGAVWESDKAQALNKGGGKPGQGYAAIRHASAVRRLTPRECERLQGFPDDWTAVPYRGKPAADGPRYKALGNSMAVPVMRWIGQRIQMVDDLLNTGDQP